MMQARQRFIRPVDDKSIVNYIYAKPFKYDYTYVELIKTFVLLHTAMFQMI
jgi:hypothetical protein